MGVADREGTTTRASGFAPSEASSGHHGLAHGGTARRPHRSPPTKRGTVSLISPTWTGSKRGRRSSRSTTGFISAGSNSRFTTPSSKTVELKPGTRYLVQGFDTETRGRAGNGARSTWRTTSLRPARCRSDSSPGRTTFLAEFGSTTLRVEMRDRVRPPGRAHDRRRPSTDTIRRAGNGNHVLEPGETARLNVTVVNDGR